MDPSICLLLSISKSLSCPQNTGHGFISLLMAFCFVPTTLKECVTCLSHQQDQLQQADVVSAAISHASGGHTEAQQEAQGCHYNFLYL